jgi:methylphosphotriester-DNA--protein-cysteine methyltransferase
VGLKPSRFHQLFREKHGLTPLEYRRAVKND